MGIALLAAAVGGAPPRALAAQPAGIVLQLHPRSGDTLRLRLDQTIEMGGTTQPTDDSVATQMTSLIMLARIAIEGVDADGAAVVALADSVRVETSDPYPSPTLMSARALQGQRFRFRVAPDGATTMGGGDAWGGASAVGSLFSQLPATLPREAVLPGATWNRTVEIPLAASPDGRANAMLTATFRFDSLSRNGEYAYLSMTGRLVRSGPMQGKGAGFVQTSGSVSGSILIDRRRGWITDARSVISLRSLMSPKMGNSLPVRVRMKITQWMRVM